MKKIITFMLMGIFCISVIAQENEMEEKGTEATPVVKAAFQKDYPNVKNVEWSAEKSDFEAEFKLNGLDCSANYNQAGKLVEFEQSVKHDQLPKAAQEYIAKNYPNLKITEAAKITDEKNAVSFEAELNENGKAFDLIFDANGKFLSKNLGD
jgi:hypothetical protein